MIRALSLAACALASGCTLDEGHGFATMKAGELRMALEASEARDLGDGAFLTDRGYRIRPHELSVRVERLVLLELHEASGGLSVRFDPANPPAGFTLCHGGHCHAEDGRLVDYEDVQALSAGGVARFEPLVAARVDREFDLVEGARAVLAEHEPSAELPESSIDRLEIELSELRLRAAVVGGDLTAPAELELQLRPAPLSKVVSLAIDRDGPAEIELSAFVRFDATMLDGMDLAARVEDGRVKLDDGAPDSASISEWLARAEVDVGF